MTLKLRTGILSVNLQEEELICRRTALIYYATTTAFAKLMISTLYSNDSAILRVIISLSVLVISTVTSNPPPRCKDKIQHVYPRLFTLYETLCSINLTNSELNMRKIKNCSKTWLYLVSNQSAFLLMN